MNLRNIFSSSALFVFSLWNWSGFGARRDTETKPTGSQNTQSCEPSVRSTKRVYGKQQNSLPTSPDGKRDTRQYRKLRTDNRCSPKRLLWIAKKGCTSIAATLSRAAYKMLPNDKQPPVQSEAAHSNGYMDSRTLLPELPFNGASPLAQRFRVPVHEWTNNGSGDVANHDKARKSVQSRLSFKKTPELVDPNTNEKLQRSFNRVGPFEIHRIPSVTSENLGDTGKWTHIFVSSSRHSLWSGFTNTSDTSSESFSASESMYSESLDAPVPQRFRSKLPCEEPMPHIAPGIVRRMASKFDKMSCHEFLN